MPSLLVNKEVAAKNIALERRNEEGAHNIKKGDIIGWARGFVRKRTGYTRVIEDPQERI